MKPDNLVLKEDENKNITEVFFIDTDPLFFIKLDNLKKKYNNSMIEKLKIYNQFVAVYQLNLFLKQEILQTYLENCIEGKTINLLELVYYLFIIDNYIKEESHNSIYTNQQAGNQPGKTHRFNTIPFHTFDSNYVLLTQFIEQYFYGSKNINKMVDDNIRSKIEMFYANYDLHDLHDNIYLKINAIIIAIQIMNNIYSESPNIYYTANNFFNLKTENRELIQFMIKLRLNLRKLIIVQNIENKTNHKFNDIINEPTNHKFIDIINKQTKFEDFFKSIYVNK